MAMKRRRQRPEAGIVRARPRLPEPPLQHDRLCELLTYFPEAGVFVWNVATRNGVAQPGALAGTLHPDGYLRIGIDGKHYAAGRLAWFYVHGTWPPSPIKHINGNEADDHIDNLQSRTALENIFARCVVRGECWEWTGARRPSGYEVVWSPEERKNEGPHRVVMRCLGRDIEGKHVCHRCDNPPCCNPDHLFVGTAADNVHDCITKGRFSLPPIGVRWKNAKGISFRRGYFIARIQVNGRRRELGYFKSPEEAAAARLRAVIEARGT
jgi:hypothetical protein